MSARYSYDRYLQAVPVDWNVNSISEISTVVGGGTPSRDVSQFWHGSIPWVTPGEVSSEASIHISGTRENISTEGLRGSGATLLPPGSLMITTRATLGARAINIVPMTTNQGFKSLVFKVPSDALFYYFLVDRLKPEFVRRASGTTFLEVSGTEVGQIKVPVPPTYERALIAEILVMLDTTIRQTEEIIEKLKQVKQGLLHDLLTRGIDANGELRPPQIQAPHLYKDSPLGWVPNEWRTGKIEEFVARIIDYRGKTPVKCASGIPLITAKNVRLGYVDSEPQEFISEGAYDQWMTRGIPQRGDVLFTMEAPLGNVAQIESDERLAFAQRIIILQAGQSTISSFFKFLLLGEPFRRSLFRMGSGSTVEGIQQSTFRRLSIAVPSSLTEQREIVRTLDESGLAIDREVVALKKMRKTKAGLMDDLLTGRVRVTPLLNSQGAQS